MNKKFLILFFSIFLIVSFSVYFLLLISGGTFLYNEIPSSSYPFFNRLSTTYKSTGEVSYDGKIGQIFHSDHENLNRIDLRMISSNDDHNIILHLRYNTSSTEDVRAVVGNSKNMKIPDYYSFKFKEIPDSKNKTYYFFLTTDSPVDYSGVSVWYNPNPMDYTQGSIYSENDGINCNWMYDQSDLINNSTSGLMTINGGGSHSECVLVHQFSTPQNLNGYNNVSLFLKSNRVGGIHELFLFTDKGIVHYTIPVTTTDWKKYTVELKKPTDFSNSQDLSNVISIRVDLNDGTRPGTYLIGPVILNDNSSSILVDNNPFSFWNASESSLGSAETGNLLFIPYYKIGINEYWKIIEERITALKPYNEFSFIILFVLYFSLVLMIGLVIIRYMINNRLSKQLQ